MVLPRAMVTLLAAGFGGVLVLAVKTIHKTPEDIGLDLKGIIFLLPKLSTVISWVAVDEKH